MNLVLAAAKQEDGEQLRCGPEEPRGKYMLGVKETPRFDAHVVLAVFRRPVTTATPRNRKNGNNRGRNKLVATAARQDAST